MRFTRRILLFFGLTSVLLPVSSALRAGPIATNTTPRQRIIIDEKTLAAWVDTLLPADSETPAASALDIHTILRERAKANRGVADILAEGLLWLNVEAAGRGEKSFKLARQPTRDAIAREAEASPRDSIQKRFFGYTLDEVMKLYYSNEIVWKSLDYRGPPQPHGFPDYAQAPRQAARGDR